MTDQSSEKQQTTGQIETDVKLLEERMGNLRKIVEELKESGKKQQDELTNQNTSDQLLQQSIESVNQTLQFLRESNEKLKEYYQYLKENCTKSDYCAKQKEKLDKLRSDVDEINKDVEKLKNDLKTTKETVGKVSETGNNTSKRLDNLEDDVEDLPTSQQMNELQNTCDYILKKYKTAKIVWRTVIAVLLAIAGIIAFLANLGKIGELLVKITS